MGQKPHCPNCGKKIGKTDRMKLKLMSTSMGYSSKAQVEFTEVYDKGWCPKCIADFFKPKFKEAMKELGGRVIPEKFKGLLKKAEKEAEK